MHGWRTATHSQVSTLVATTYLSARPLSFTPKLSVSLSTGLVLYVDGHAVVRSKIFASRN